MRRSLQGTVWTSSGLYTLLLSRLLAAFLEFLLRLPLRRRELHSEVRCENADEGGYEEVRPRRKIRSTYVRCTAVHLGTPCFGCILRTGFVEHSCALVTERLRPCVPSKTIL